MGVGFVGILGEHVPGQVAEVLGLERVEPIGSRLSGSWRTIAAIAVAKMLPPFPSGSVKLPSSRRFVASTSR